MPAASHLSRLFLLSLFAVTAAAPCAATDTAQAPYQVEPLAEGVFLFLPLDASIERTNSLLVLREDGPLVVDSQPSPQAARDLLAQIRELTTDPVRYLVLSHPHAEAAGGASAFPNSTTIIGSAGCVRYLKDEEFDFGAEIRRRAPDPLKWTAPPRRLPHLVLRSAATLDDPRNPVELRPVAPGHTHGDMVVEVPQASVMYAGALLFLDRNPYVSDGSVGGWLRNLNDLAKMPPQTLVPIRGAATDAATVRRLRDSLAWVRGQVAAAFVDRLPWEEIPPLVLAAPDAASYFDLEVEPSFLPALVERAVRENVARRKRRGYD